MDRRGPTLGLIETKTGKKNRSTTDAAASTDSQPNLLTTRPHLIQICAFPAGSTARPSARSLPIMTAASTHLLRERHLYHSGEKTKEVFTHVVCFLPVKRQ